MLLIRIGVSLLAVTLGLTEAAAQPAAIGATESSPPPYRLPDLEPGTDSAAATLQDVGEVVVTQIRVDGVTVLDAETVAATARPYVGRTVTMAELQTLRLELTRLYVDRGYVSSGVVLPGQTVRDGLVVFHAIEGTVDRIDLEAGSHLKARYIAARLERQIDTPLQISDLQFALRYLEEDPNIRRLDAALRPGERAGESVLRLRIDEEPRFSAGLVADNHRSASTGADRASVFFSSRNLTGFGEELVASFGASRGAGERSAALSVPFLARNATAQISYARSDADIIERAFRSFDIESESIAKTVSVRLPWIENLDFKWGTSFGFEANRSRTSLMGMPFSFSVGAQDGVARTSVGSLRTDFQWRGAASVTVLDFAYRRGLDTRDATIYVPKIVPEEINQPEDLNLGEADGIFTNLQSQITHIRRINTLPAFRGLSDRAQLRIRAATQISRDPLLSLEKFAVGGVDTVRGLPENLLVRDNGVAATFEVQLPIPNYRATPHPLNLVLVPFVDYGRSWDEVDTDLSSDVRNTDDPRYILSAGVGALWQPLRGLTAQLFWGREIADNFGDDDPREFRGNDLQDRGIHLSVGYVRYW